MPGKKDSPFLVVPFEVKGVKEEGEDFIVEGIASMYGNVDLGEDIVMAGCFAEDLKENGDNRPVLWQHRWDEPIGLGTFSENVGGLMMRATLPRDDDFVKGRVMPQVRKGSLTGLSIGFGIQDFDYTEEDGKRIRRLKRCKLYETSLVTFPMNEAARITAAKQFIEENTDGKAVPPLGDYPIAEDDTAWNGKQAVKDIREATGSTEEPNKAYKRGFFFYDPDDADDYSGYKMPKLMKVGDDLKYIPKGLAAVVGALAGARGGVDIPEADKEKIKGQLNQLYKKMGKEEPFGSKGVTIIDAFTIKNMRPEDLRRLWDDGVVLSSGAKDYVSEAVFGKAMPEGSPDNDSGFLSDLEALNEKIKEL